MACARCMASEATIAELEDKVRRLQDGCRRLLNEYVMGTGSQPVSCKGNESEGRYTGYDRGCPKTRDRVRCSGKDDQSVRGAR